MKDLRKAEEVEPNRDADPIRHEINALQSLGQENCASNRKRLEHHNNHESNIHFAALRALPCCR